MPSGLPGTALLSAFRRYRVSRAVVLVVRVHVDVRDVLGSVRGSPSADVLVRHPAALLMRRDPEGVSG